MSEVVLAGLVTDGAAKVYERLRVADLPVGSGPGRLDVESGPGRELLEAGVLFFKGGGEERFARAVHPAMALRRLLDRQHRRMSALQTGLAATWERLAAIASPTSGLSDDGIESEDVRAVRDREEMARLASGLYRSPRRLLRATFNARSGSGPTTEGIILPPADAVAAGVEFRMIYDTEHASDRWGSYSIQQSVQAGEQARIRKTVPVKMVHVDDLEALVTIDRAGAKGALHVRSPAFLSLLAEWFDALWLAPDTTEVSSPDPVELTPVRRKVLCLMASGLTDESIAHHTGTNVRTVRRHVSAILETLQVDSRFSAGVAAVKRGWL